MGQTPPLVWEIFPLNPVFFFWRRPLGWTLIILWIHCLFIPETLSKYAEVDQQATPWTTICPVEMNKYEWKSREILMIWVPNWRLNLSQTGGWKKNGDCGSNIKQKLVSAVDTDSLCVWLANDVPNTSGFMQFFRKIRLQSQIRPFLGVRSTNPLSRASVLRKLGFGLVEWRHKSPIKA